MTSKPTIEVLDVELKHTNADIEAIAKEFNARMAKLETKQEEFDAWRSSCTKVAIWWMGFAAAVMTIATFIQAKFDAIFHIAEKLK